MGVENRPYVGTWRLNQKELVQMTPDSLVFVNGDTALPGCPKCSGRIDIQKFVTEVSVDAGTDPGSASASFSLSIPLHHSENFARDAKFILVPGLEVHIYMRGYFPVKGLFGNLAEPRFAGEIIPSESPQRGEFSFQRSGNPNTGPRKPDGSFYSTRDLVGPNALKVMLAQGRLLQGTDPPYGYTDAWMAELREHGVQFSREEIAQNMEKTLAMVKTLHQYMEQQGYENVEVRVSENGGLTTHGHKAYGTHHTGEAIDYTIYSNGRRVDKTISWAVVRKLQKSGHFPPGGVGAYLQSGQSPTSNPKWTTIPHFDHGGSRSWIWLDGVSQSGEAGRAWLAALDQNLSGLPEPTISSWEENLNGPPPEKLDSALGEEWDVDGSSRNQGLEEFPSLLDEYGLNGRGIEDVLSYPYYHVFHGVVTQVSHSWSGGTNTISVSCASMLHFWQYHTISTNASIFGARPQNSRLKTSMVGHNFTGMHPYQILYTLHHDMVGAAGGVGWALSSKVNQTAVSSVTGESLFSLNIRYWEERFSSRMIKLRLHGANGELFSAAQSAFLGRTSSKSLTSLVRHRFKHPNSRKNRSKEIMEDAISVGLFNNRKLEALLFARSTRPQGKNDTKFELNLAEMQAFVSNIGNWGQIDLFESAYESKLDIAQKVMEVTGFEFYQDVDGDFVFKPPMYNLDTRSSRIYRIEDIDIISISHEEKEPQATYATVKSSQFKNLQGTGVENEWGVRGQYIDYRLVAQFGWRPVQYETSYFNDPKSMFFSAINRLDIMNAPSRSASVTIPIRPEMRPGYPVYIPYLDSFYYCNSFAHSYSVGGQCTTSLQLIAKRSKFYAPGKPDVNGIDAIDLGNTILPQRPLEVSGKDGHPRLAGFPNVVMALDPNEINPLFWAVGADIERLDDPVVLRNLLKMSSQPGIKFLKDNRDGTYTFETPQGVNEENEQTWATVKFFLSDDLRLPEEQVKKKSRSEVARQVPQGAVDIRKAGQLYAKRTQASNKKVEKFQRDLVSLRRDINLLTSRISNTKSETTISRLQGQVREKEQKITDLLKQIDGEKETFEASLGQDQGDNVHHLVRLIKNLGEHYWVQQNSDERKIFNTHNLLDMLSDKKAILSNGTQPGAYRYFSASHPDPDQQGQDQILYSNPPDNVTPEIITKNSFLDPEYQDTDVDGFVRTPSNRFTGGFQPEAQIGPVRPVRGVRVLTSNPEKPQGEVLPTSEIRELSFSIQETVHSKNSTDSKPDDRRLSLGSSVQDAIKQRFSLKSLGKEASIDTTLFDFFGQRWSELEAEVALAFRVSRLEAQRIDNTKEIPTISTPSFPETIRFGRAISVGTRESLSNFKFEGSTGTQSLGRTFVKKSLTDVLNFAGDKLGVQFLTNLQTARAIWIQDLKSVGFSDPERDQIQAALNSALAAKFRVAVKGIGTTKFSKETSTKRLIQSPVFPVSDKEGYEVVGAYRYGRDVDIEPGGVWDSLHAQDPLQFLDRKSVEDVVDAIVSSKPITVTQTKTLPGGRTVSEKVQLSGTEAVSAVEKKVLSQLRSNLTDKQIIDYGLTEPGKDPTQVKLSLSNWFSEGNKEGIFKLPINNAAFSLGDLTFHTEGKVCSCKAAEADILIEAFGQEAFLQFAQPGATLSPDYGTGDEDRTTQFLTNQALLSSVPWQTRQNALRGESMDRAAPLTTQSFTELGESLAQSITGQSVSQQRALASFKAAQERFLNSQFFEEEE